MKPSKILLIVPLAFLTACVHMPSGPRIAVMPPPGKPLEVFNVEDRDCRAYAHNALGANPSDLGSQQMAGSAIAGTIIGASVGTLISGGRAWGTQHGAGMGLMMGTSIGANQGQYTANDAQRRYDIAYSQCMYSKGNLLPGMRASNALPPPPRSAAP